MSQPGRQVALSPVLLFGIALRLVPGSALQAVASFAMTVIRRHHRDLFERLRDLENGDFLIQPSDFPARFLLSVAAPTPRLTVLGANEDPTDPVAATITGPLPDLVDLLEGRTDGDALFFSRALTLEGDMAAVVALRNAVDGAEISIADDLSRILGPFGAPARGLARACTALYRRADADLETLQSAILAPVARRCDRHESRLRDLEGANAGRRARKPGRRA